MTSSSSRAKASHVWFILVALLLLTGVASADRKRIVVLEFEGDKAERFQADVVKLIKKSHTVVSADKWNGTAEEMSATKLTDKNVKKVAKKLKVDGVLSGTVEKRRDEYIMRLKLRSGVSGELVGGQINIKSESAKLDSTATKDVKDELIDVIAGLESNRGGGGGDDEEEEEEKPKKSGFGKKKPADDEEEEEEKPKKSGFGKKKPADEEEEEEKPKKTAKKPVDEEEEKPKKAAAPVKKPVEEEEEKPKKVAAPAKKPAEDEEEKPAKKPADEDEEEKPKKKVAAKERDDDEEDGGELEASADTGPMDAAAMYSPSERAVDAVFGMSLTGRRMSFSYDADRVAQRPAGYKQTVPVPGVYFDATVFPLAIGHKRRDLLRGLGATVMFDRVLSLSSKNPNDQMATKLKSSEQRFAIGAAFRYPLGTGASAPVVGGTLRYNKQSFTIEGDAAVPDVGYSMVDLAGFFQYPMNPKMMLGVSLGAFLPFDAGEITKLSEFGRAKITGFELGAGLDYLLTKNIFARGELRLETLGYSFLGEGERSMGVTGARDTYFGAAFTAGFLY